MSNNPKFIINTDGGSRGNPGHAACSFIIFSEDGVIWDQEGSYLGIATNNEAEYEAVKSGLQRIKEKFTDKMPIEVEIRTDSLLIASQLSGKYKIKNMNLRKYYDQIKNLEKEIGKISYVYIPREKNYLADKLVNITLDKRLNL